MKGWTEVRRKKQAPMRVRGDTTFFVSDVPDNTNKTDLRRRFAEYREISNVYMGTKKRWNRQNFVFIRFREVMTSPD